MSARQGWAELWLTPAIGVAGLAAYGLHDHISLWRSLGVGYAVVLAAVAVLLIAAGAVAAGLRRTKWPAWAQLGVAAAVACVAVWAAWTVAAAHYYDITAPGTIVDEGRADTIAIWQYQADVAAGIAALAVVLAGVAARRKG